MEERICPECGRKFKVVIGQKEAIVIPITPKPEKPCSTCGKFT